MTDLYKNKIENYSLYATHDRHCDVFHDEHAVYQCNLGIFYPSWRAQHEGWHLVHATNWFQRLLLKWFFL